LFPYKIIKASHTVTVGDAFIGLERLKMANEGSGKKKIGEFMKALSKLKINPRDVSLAKESDSLPELTVF
jgi:hypothetical protein